MRVPAIVPALIGLSALFTVAVGSFEGAVEVLQPIVTHEIIQICAVTYVPHWGTYAPGIRIEFTCSPNSVMTQNGFENRNGANLCGLEVRLLQNPKDQGGLFGDTLRVELNVANLHAAGGFPNVSPDSVVAATLECILGNVKSDSRLRHLDVRIAGNPNLSGHAGTWNLNELAESNRRRYFYH